MANLFLGKQQQQQQQQLRVVLLLLVATMILFQEVSLVEAAARPLMGMRMGMGMGIGIGIGIGDGDGRGGSGHNIKKMFETLGIRTCKCCIINNNNNNIIAAGGDDHDHDHEYYSCKTIYISDDQQHMTGTATADCPKLECLPWKL